MMLEKFMVTKTLIDSVSETAQRPAVRNRQIGIRLTEPEYSEVEQIAWKSGRTLADWAHDALVQNLASGTSTDMEMHIFTELVGIQMLLMKTLEPLLCGEKLTREQVSAHFRQVQTTKAAQAQDLLAKRSQKQEK
jgi:hypothetical protein